MISSTWNIVIPPRWLPALPLGSPRGAADSNNAMVDQKNFAVVEKVPSDQQCSSDTVETCTSGMHSSATASSSITFIPGGVVTLANDIVDATFSDEVTVRFSCADFLKAATVEQRLEFAKNIADTHETKVELIQPELLLVITGSWDNVSSLRHALIDFRTKWLAVSQQANEDLTAADESSNSDEINSADCDAVATAFEAGDESVTPIDSVDKHSSPCPNPIDVSVPKETAPARKRGRPKGTKKLLPIKGEESLGSASSSRMNPMREARLKPSVGLHDDDELHVEGDSLRQRAVENLSMWIASEGVHKVLAKVEAGQTDELPPVYRTRGRKSVGRPPGFRLPAQLNAEVMLTRQEQALVDIDLLDYPISAVPNKFDVPQLSARKRRKHDSRNRINKAVAASFCTISSSSSTASEDSSWPMTVSDLLTQPSTPSTLDGIEDVSEFCAMDDQNLRFSAVCSNTTVASSQADVTGSENAATSVDKSRNRSGLVNARVKKRSRWFCGQCRFKSKFKISLMRHKLRHERGLKLLECASCDFVTFNPRILNRHNGLAHSSAALKTCPVCNSFSSLKDRSVKHHMYRVHGSFSQQRAVAIPARLYKCKLCDFQTTAAGYLSRHLKKHTAAKAANFRSVFQESEAESVPVCSNADELKPKQFFECDLCSYKTSNKVVMARHARYTHGECKFKCDKCDKSFKQAWSLKQHQKNIHSGLSVQQRLANASRVAACEVCGKKFKSESYVKKHMRCHSNERPVLCDTCGLAFKTTSAMHRHARLKHILAGQPRLICELCPAAFDGARRSFVSEEGLRRHQRKKHIFHLLATKQIPTKRRPYVIGDARDRRASLQLQSANRTASLRSAPDDRVLPGFFAPIDPAPRTGGQGAPRGSFSAQAASASTYIPSGSGIQQLHYDDGGQALIPFPLVQQECIEENSNSSISSLNELTSSRHFHNANATGPTFAMVQLAPATRKTVAPAAQRSAQEAAASRRFSDGDLSNVDTSCIVIELDSTGFPVLRRIDEANTLSSPTKSAGISKGGHRRTTLTNDEPTASSQNDRQICALAEPAAGSGAARNAQIVQPKILKAAERNSEQHESLLNYLLRETSEAGNSSLTRSDIARPIFEQHRASPNEVKPVRPTFQANEEFSAECKRTENTVVR